VDAVVRAQFRLTMEQGEHFGCNSVRFIPVLSAIASLRVVFSRRTPPHHDSDAAASFRLERPPFWCLGCSFGARLSGGAPSFGSALAKLIVPRFSFPFLRLWESRSSSSSDWIPPQLPAPMSNPPIERLRALSGSGGPSQPVPAGREKLGKALGSLTGPRRALPGCLNCSILQTFQDSNELLLEMDGESKDDPIRYLQFDSDSGWSIV
jgi:hypothetical protein